MNTEFIKWMCEKAEGFEVLVWPNCTHIRVPFSREHSVDMDDAHYLFSNNKHLKGYLLQRAIEGVNKPDGGCFVSQLCDCLYVYHAETTNEYKYYYFKDITIDQAKESALLYIYNQELDKNKEVK